MKKKVFGRKLKRDANERKALFKNLLTSLVLNERIKTTEAKAKAIKSQADKLVTKAKKGGISAERNLHPDVNQNAVDKLIKDIAPRFAKRNGGYTRIIRVAKKRVADGAQMVYLEWTEKAAATPIAIKKTKKTVSATKKTATVKEKRAPKAAVKKVPAIAKKEQSKPKTGGFLKQLISRQKKG